VEWRSLTVQRLAVEGASPQESRATDVASTILHWTSDCLGLDISAESMAQIRHNLKTEVVAKAIEFSLFLRRQYSIISPHIPQNLDRLIANYISLGKRAKLKICIRPQLRRLSLTSTKGPQSHDIIVEAELSVLKLRTPILEEKPAQSPLPVKQDEID
jgi:hypothetical protein